VAPCVCLTLLLGRLSLLDWTGETRFGLARVAPFQQNWRGRKVGEKVASQRFLLNFATVSSGEQVDIHEIQSMCARLSHFIIIIIRIIIIMAIE